MKTKNKRFISFLLASSMLFSFAGCEKISSIISDRTEETSSVSNEESTKQEVTTSTTNESMESKATTTELTTIPFYYDDENVYVTGNVNLREKNSLNSDVIMVIDKYEKAKRIKTNNEWDYVSYNGTEGYVASKYVKELGDTFVEVDISEQNLYLYVDDSLELTADVVTGKKNKYDTRLGCHPIYSKEKGRYLKGEGYKVYVDYWLPFDKGQGLHDASWRTSFDKDDYLNGSHGCVNMKPEDAKYVYDNVEVGTKVLVHK